MSVTETESPERWKRILDAVQTVLGIVSSLAGIGFLFILTGHIIVNCYTENMKLYGLAEFSDRFVLDANISFMNNFFSFLHENNVNAVTFVAALGLSVIVSLLNGRKLADGDWLSRGLAKKGGSRGWLVSHVERYFFHGVIISCILAGIVFSKIPKPFFIYVVCLPVLTGSLIVLFMVIPAAFRRKRDRKLSVSLILLTSLVIVTVPFVYGRSIYDMSVYEVDAISYRPSDTTLTAIDSMFLDSRNHNTYIIANYSDKLIFVVDDLYSPGYTHFIPIDKTEVGSFRLKIENSPDGELSVMKLRDLVSIDTITTRLEALSIYKAGTGEQPAETENEEAYLKSFGVAQ